MHMLLGGFIITFLMLWFFNGIFLFRQFIFASFKLSVKYFFVDFWFCWNSKYLIISKGIFAAIFHSCDEGTFYWRREKLANFVFIFETHTLSSGATSIKMYCTLPCFLCKYLHIENGGLSETEQVKASWLRWLSSIVHVL